MRSWMIAILSGWYLILAVVPWWHAAERLLKQYDGFYPALSLGIVFTVLIVLLRRKIFSSGKQYYRHFLVVSSLVLVSGALAAGYSYQKAHAIPVQLDGAVVIVKGRVCPGGNVGVNSSGVSGPGHVRAPSVQRYQFCADQINADIRGFNWKASNADYPLLLSCYYCDYGLQTGVTYQLSIRLKANRPLLNFSQPFAWQKVWALPSIAKGSIRKILHQEAMLVSDEVFDKTKLRHRISSILQQSSHAASLTALILGDRSLLSDRQWELLNQSGLTHLLVISGLHIGMIASFGFLLAKVLGRKLPRKLQLVFGSILALTCVLSFVAVINVGVPVVRAASATIIGLLLLYWRKSGLMSSWLLLTICVCSIISPFAVFSSGFWLSFGGVAVLLVLFGRRLGRENSKIIVLWRSQVGFFLGMAGLLAFSFGGVSSGSVPANLVAVPLICLLVLPLAVLAVVAGFLSPVLLSPVISHQLLQATSALLDCFWWVAEKCSGFPVFEFSGGLWLVVALLVVGGICLLHFRIPMVAWGVPLFVMAGSQGGKPEVGGLVIDVFDVGQGLSVMSRHDGQVVIYDTGPKYAKWDAGKYVLTPALIEAGVERLSEIIVSHGDLDHSGGVAALRQQFDIDLVRSGEPERVTDSRLCLPGTTNYSELSVEVLWPSVLSGKAGEGAGSEEKQSSNDRSCVVKFYYGAFSMLLPGDIEGKAQIELVKQKGWLLKADVLILPHHGSGNAFVPEFLSAVNPQLAIATTGHLNAFGHPNKLFRNWFRNREVPLLNTAENGAIRLKVSEGDSGSAWWDVETAWPDFEQYSFVTNQ
ncbi:DNA internalization-related competence protein ComEC/Rec2 [Hahella ganghwensis]|uniref:DNA internalization-related competence protein ComEC/Rec2 n=1 Tax=Hahella ganghwensis TaxID=286420 RepID=UPI0003624448|nr:DNA internalization-related competence protein ComEC/Rec2 [Hahella ganghwensis]